MTASDNSQTHLNQYTYWSWESFVRTSNTDPSPAVEFVVTLTRKRKYTVLLLLFKSSVLKLIRDWFVMIDCGYLKQLSVFLVTHVQLKLKQQRHFIYLYINNFFINFQLAILIFPIFVIKTKMFIHAIFISNTFKAKTKMKVPKLKQTLSITNRLDFWQQTTEILENW